MGEEYVDPLDVAKLSPAQQQKLAELGKRMKSVEGSDVPPNLHDQLYLHQWLKARKYDVDKAEALLKNHLRYRKAMHMESKAFKEGGPVSQTLKKYWPRGHFGVGKEGHPIVYFPLGCVDAKGLTMAMKVSDGLRSILWFQEDRRWCCRDISAKLGKPVYQVIYVLDLQNIGMKHLNRTGMEIFQQIARLVEEQTPELIYKMMIINAPSFFTLFFNFVSGILDEATKRKMSVFGSDGWKEALQKEAAANQIPVFYGGTAVGPGEDPKCSHMISYGGDVPPELYFDPVGRHERLLPAGAELSTINIPRRKSARIYVTVDQPHSTIFWFWECMSSLDLGFGVYLLPDGAGEAVDVEMGTRVEEEGWEMVVPHFRLLTHLVPEWNSVQAPRPGLYAVVLDNSYSWVKSKDVSYYVSVSPNE